MWEKAVEGSKGWLFAVELVHYIRYGQILATE